MTQDRPLRAFIIHLSVYVLVVALLAAINLYRNPQNLWFLWVLIGWGIGMLAHGLALLLARTHRREAIFRDPRMRGLAVHAFVYLAVNALLVTVNLLYSPGYYWSLFPLLGWGVLLAGHAFLTFHRRSKGATA